MEVKKIRRIMAPLLNEEQSTLVKSRNSGAHKMRHAQ